MLEDEIGILNEAYGSLLSKESHSFSFEELANSLGKDVEKTKDKEELARWVFNSRLLIHKLWREVYERSEQYVQDYADWYPSITRGFPKWKEEHPEIHHTLCSWLLSDDEKIHLIVQAKQFDGFLKFLNRQNRYLVISRKRAYVQPDYWQFISAINRSVKRAVTYELNSLIRMQQYGMPLPNGDNIQRYILEAENKHKALAYHRPRTFDCEFCLDAGIETSFRSQEELSGHIRENHASNES